jgi:polyisoprenyl-teichoic acid--peptidoglycan teichoic acid transferase
MPNKKTVADIQTGRNLPHRFNSYSPSHRRLSQTPQPNIQSVTTRSRPSVRRRLSASLLIALAILIILGVLIGVWDARNISAAEKKMFGTGNLLSLIGTTPLKGADSGHVNILLVGYSVDDPGHPAATLTDSLIVLSMSTSNHTGYMLSIPRDLYVKIPGFDYGKINEAYQDGGISLLEQIIITDFQIPINYYSLINYATVRDTVNGLGGITVDIHSPDPRGLYDPNISPKDGGPLKLSNGSQTLDGQTALNLTRARGETFDSYGFPQSDFNRTQNQRLVLAAMKAKANWKLILNPRRNNQILSAVASNVKTDIKAGEVRSVFSLFNNISSSKLRSLSLNNLDGTNYLVGTYYEGDTLSPVAGLNDYSAIDAALQQFNQ